VNKIEIETIEKLINAKDTQGAINKNLIDSVVLHHETFDIIKSASVISENSHTFIGVKIITHNNVPKDYAFLRQGMELKAIIDLKNGSLFPMETKIELDI